MRSPYQLGANFKTEFLIKGVFAIEGITDFF